MTIFHVLFDIILRNVVVRKYKYTFSGSVNWCYTGVMTQRSVFCNETNEPRFVAHWQVLTNVTDGYRPTHLRLFRIRVAFTFTTICVSCPPIIRRHAPYSNSSTKWVNMDYSMDDSDICHLHLTNMHKNSPSATSQARFSWEWWAFLISLSVRIFSSARVKNILQASKYRLYYIKRHTWACIIF